MENAILTKFRIQQGRLTTQKRLEAPPHKGVGFQAFFVCCNMCFKQMFKY